MVSVNDGFVRYLTEAAGPDRAAAVLSALDGQPSVSVRLNPFKRKPSFPETGPVPWSRHGFFLDSRPTFTLDPYFHAGCYYVQDSSAMFVGHIFRKILEKLHTDPDRAVRVLDLCASPGGKTTDAAASLRETFGDRYLLVSNEVIKSRAATLSGNAAVWGDPNVVVTSSDPADIGRLEGFFDVIIADVPCSGEGMFRKDENAAARWSADNVALCSARQKRILADVWPALASDGFLIYSTCTFNRYENDDNVLWAEETLGAENVFPEPDGTYGGVVNTRCGYALFPGLVRGEGQYCAVLRKNGDSVCGFKLRAQAGTESHFLKDWFDVPVAVVEKGDLLKAVPSAVAAEVSFLESRLRVLSSGCAAGRRKGRDFIPDADLALSICLAGGMFPRMGVDRSVALKFLHRDTLVLPDAEKGYVMVCYDDVPLGFVKNLGGRCNNLYPQERRIRMDVD